MTLPHDCTARLDQLRETIEKNRDNLLKHDFEIPRRETETVAAPKK